MLKTVLIHLVHVDYIINHVVLLSVLIFGDSILTVIHMVVQSFYHVQINLFYHHYETFHKIQNNMRHIFCCYEVVRVIKVKFKNIKHY